VYLTYELATLHAPSSPPFAAAHTILSFSTSSGSTSRAALRRQNSSPQRCFLDFGGTTADFAHLSDTSYLHSRPASLECEPFEPIANLFLDRQQCHRATKVLPGAASQSSNVLSFTTRWSPHLPCTRTAYGLPCLQSPDAQPNAKMLHPHA